MVFRVGLANDCYVLGGSKVVSELLNYFVRTVFPEGEAEVCSDFLYGFLFRAGLANDCYVLGGREMLCDLVSRRELACGGLGRSR